MLYHHFIQVVLLQFALFTLVLSAGHPGGVRKPPPEIAIPPPKPDAGQGANNNGGTKTPAEKESDLIEKLSDLLERIGDGIKEALDKADESAAASSTPTPRPTAIKPSKSSPSSSSCDATCQFAACSLITAIPNSYISVTSCPMTTEATAGVAGQITLGGAISCKADWVQEQICRATLSDSATSISMTQYVGAAWDVAVSRCAAYVASAAPSSDVGLTSYEGLCSSKHYPVSASSWSKPTTTSTSLISTTFPTPTNVNAAVAMGWGDIQRAALPLIGALVAFLG